MTKFVAWAKDQSDISAQRYWTRYMGADGLKDPHLETISPADHVDKATVPILIIHGKDDTVVPFEQSQLMVDALTRAGHPPQLVILGYEDHWLSHGDARPADAAGGGGLPEAEQSGVLAALVGS